MKQIIAIGGGGFGREIGELKIEKYIVKQSNKSKPKICFEIGRESCRERV